MAGLQVLNFSRSMGYGWPFRGQRGRRGVNPLDSIMSARPQENNDDLLALLVSVLMQQQNRGADREESALQREMNREILGERREERIGQASLAERQFEELSAGRKSERELFEQALRREQTARITDRGRATFARRRQREQERLGLRAREAGTAFGKEFSAGRRVMDAAMQRVGVALAAIQGAEDPTTKQAATLEKVFEKAVDVARSAVTAGGAVAEGGVTKAEGLGVLQELAGVASIMATLDVGREGEIKRRLSGLVERGSQLSGSLSDIVTDFGGPPVTLEGGLQGEFAERGDLLAGRGLDLEGAYEAMRDELLTRELEGGSPAETARYREQRTGEIEAENPLAPFEPSTAVGPEGFASLLEALDRPTAEARPVPAGMEGLSPAVQDIFGAETERRTGRAEVVQTKAEQERELADIFNAQTNLGLRGAPSAAWTGIKLGASKIGGLFEGLGSVGAQLPPGAPPAEMGALLEYLARIEEQKREAAGLGFHYRRP